MIYDFTPGAFLPKSLQFDAVELVVTFGVVDEVNAVAFDAVAFETVAFDTVTFDAVTFEAVT